MNMVQTIAKQNRKYYRKRNLLIGIAVFLSSFLIFVILSIGVVFQQEQYASINAYNPNWHGWYKHVTKETAEQLMAQPNIEKCGLFKEMAFTELPKEKYVYYYYMTEETIDMLRLKLAKGHMPEAENEIAITEEAAKRLGTSVKPGDSISFSYQVLRNEKADHSQKKECIVSGILKSEKDFNSEDPTVLVSKKLLETELKTEEISYEFLFRISKQDAFYSTVQVENIIQTLAKKYQVSVDDVSINSYNLSANYTDPDMILILSVIVCVVVLAGIITIYSIYYVRINERIQEFGRLKAIGMTTKELRYIVLKEGIGIAAKAAPLGILAGIFIEIIGLLALHANSWDIVQEILPWISVPSLIIAHIGAITLSLSTTFLMMYLSLRKPMRVVGKITEIEAIRYPAAKDSQKINLYEKKSRKSKSRVRTFHLVKTHIGRSKARSFITILSMSATGVLVMAVATILSCTDAKLYADDLCHGQYMITERVEFANEEHPEREWEVITQNNPLTDDLLQKIEAVEGVKKVTVFDSIYAEIPELSHNYEIMGVSEENASFLMDNITQGSVTYELLKSGERVIVDERAARWYYHGLKIGDTISYVVDNGEDIPLMKKAKVVALGDFPLILPGIYTASESFENLCPKNANCHSVYSIWSEEDYNIETESRIQALIEEEPLLSLHIWQENYEMEQATTRGLTVLCCIFLGILGSICIMNMINTMISSVQQRKKEIGMLQAVGMTDRQLSHMLQLEGCLYILGTLFITIAAGTWLSIRVFVWARESGFLGIRIYQFPLMAVFIIAIVLIVSEIILSTILSHSVKKETIMDRIRFY